MLAVCCLCSIIINWLNCTYNIHTQRIACYCKKKIKYYPFPKYKELFSSEDKDKCKKKKEDKYVYSDRGAIILIENKNVVERQGLRITKRLKQIRMRYNVCYYWCKLVSWTLFQLLPFCAW